MLGLRQTIGVLGTAARNGDIRRAELAWGASVSAEWAHFVALGVFAFRSGGAPAVGVAGLVRLLPAAAIAPFASSLADRFRRERFLLGVALVGASALGVSAAGAFAGNRIVVFAAAAAVGVCSTLFRPALQALLPSLARTAGDLIAANGATSTIESLGTLLGPLGAGVVVAFANVGVVFALGAAALVTAAALLSRVSVEGSLLSRVESGSAWGGFQAIARAGGGRLITGLLIAQTFVRGCLNVLIVVAAYRLLHRGAAEVGYLTAAIGAGGLLGALGAVSLRGRRLGSPLGLSLLCWGAPIMLIAPLAYFPAAILLLAIVGAANSVEDVAAFTLLQRGIPDDVLARALGAFWGLAMGAVAVGSAVAPAIVSLTGPRGAFLPVGIVLPLLWLASRKRLVEIDAAVAPAPQLALVDGLSLFAPLSLAAKERVAARLSPVEVLAGEVVVRTGEVGDRFYIVDEGELAVEAGERRTGVGPGDFFGEIALIEDVPRTATVRAITAARLYALERDDFLSAVTGHPAAHAEAHSVAAARLAGA